MTWNRVNPTGAFSFPWSLPLNTYQTPFPQQDLRRSTTFLPCLLDHNHPFLSVSFAKIYPFCRNKDNLDLFSKTKQNIQTKMVQLMEKRKMAYMILNYYIRLLNLPLKVSITVPRFSNDNLKLMDSNKLKVHSKR